MIRSGIERTLPVVMMLCAIGHVPAARGQCEGRFLPLSTDRSFGEGGPVYALKSWDADGDGPEPPKLYIGGTFQRMGGVQAANVVAWDGVDFLPLGSGITGNGVQIRDFAEFEGGLVAGGRFTSAGGSSANDVAKWDGTQWTAFGMGLTGGSVQSLAVYAETLVAVGAFTNTGTVRAAGAAVWNGTAWVQMGTGGQWTAATVHNGTLFAATGDSPGLVRRWNGENWINLPRPWTHRNVLDLESFGGLLYAGGGFFNDFPYRCCIADWNGAAWTFGPQSPIECMVAHNGRLYLGTSSGGLVSFDGTSFQARGTRRPSNVFAVEAFQTEIVVGLETAQNPLEPLLEVRWTETGIPWVARQPRHQTVALGAPATLHALAASGYDFAGAVSYQWRRNGIPLSDRPASSNSAAILGSDSPTLTLTGVRVLDQGSYDCVVSNPCGQVISNPATLTVTHLCPPDCNGDGNLDCDDLADFINAYFADEPRPAFVDFNEDAESNADDLADFINAYFLGCL